MNTTSHNLELKVGTHVVLRQPYRRYSEGVEFWYGEVVELVGENYVSLWLTTTQVSQGETYEVLVDLRRDEVLMVLTTLKEEVGDASPMTMMGKREEKELVMS
jgi:hypothetical protein